MLTFLIFLPVIGMLAILFTKKENPGQARTIGFLCSLAMMILGIVLALQCRDVPDGQTYIHETKVSWIDLGDAFHVHYHVGIDGLSGVLIALTGLLAFCAALASWKIDKGVRGYWSMFLLLHCGVIGTFASLDMFLFYVFWEVMLLPMYFLIGIWGGPRRIYASIKFFLYTLWGSIFLLAGILVIYFALTSSSLPAEVLAEFPNAQTFGQFAAANEGITGNVFSIPELTAYAAHMKGQGGLLAAFGNVTWIGLAVFWGMFIAFAVKVPVFPFHTWLPDAHVEAPTPISVILAGILLKLGGYGMLRINFPLFPGELADMAFWLGLLGVVNIVYGALVAMAQTDFKKMVAYSSVSHMGFCIIGFAAMNSQGMNGAILQLFNHGTISGLLFLVVGVAYDRAHHRDMKRFGGLLWQMPKYGTIAAIAMFASLGLPALSGFWGEFLAFIGSFGGGYEGAKVLTVIATIGLVFTAAYYLRAIQHVLLGKVNPACEKFPDADAREQWSMWPLLIPTIVFGIYPAWLIDIFQPAVAALVGN